jgi:hypothetical protein
MKRRDIVFVFTALLFISAVSLAKAVTVGPVKLEINANPGQTVTGTMFLKNDTAEAVTFYPSFETFTEQNGTKVFLKTPSDLASWFKVANVVQLGPNEQKTIPFSIDVPKNAAPGGHFAVAWWSTTPPSSNSQNVSIITRAGILVYLRVSGDIKESASLTLGGPLFSVGFPLTFSVGFNNTGNVAVTPQGTLEIKSFFGNTVNSVPFNNGGAIILPQSSNNFNLNWQSGGFYFGPYQAILTATYGESNQTATQSHWFFLISWNILVIILVVILLAFVLPRLISRYNKWVIKKARGR